MSPFSRPSHPITEVVTCTTEHALKDGILKGIVTLGDVVKSRLTEKKRLCNLMSGLLDLCWSIILALPFNIRFFSTGPFVVDFDEDSADQAFE